MAHEARGADSVSRTPTSALSLKARGKGQATGQARAHTPTKHTRTTTAPHTSKTLVASSVSVRPRMRARGHSVGELTESGSRVLRERHLQPSSVHVKADRRSRSIGDARTQNHQKARVFCPAADVRWSIQYTESTGKASTQQ